MGVWVVPQPLCVVPQLLRVVPQTFLSLLFWLASLRNWFGRSGNWSGRPAAIECPREIFCGVAPQFNLLALQFSVPAIRLVGSRWTRMLPRYNRDSMQSPPDCHDGAPGCSVWLSGGRVWLSWACVCVSWRAFAFHEDALAFGVSAVAFRGTAFRFRADPFASRVSTFVFRGPTHGLHVTALNSRLARSASSASHPELPLPRSVAGDQNCRSGACVGVPAPSDGQNAPQVFYTSL
jgi:hypothetical protein